MRKILTTIAGLLLITHPLLSQNNIAEARGMATGTTVTVKGVVTNGAELGGIRYLQDATAGIAAYSWDMGDVLRGDSVVVTGVLKDYNKLLELDPVTAFTVLDSGLPLPAPLVITPAQMGESYEAELVRINNAIFSSAGNTFAGNTNYTITAGGQTTQLRVNNNSSLVGTVIPSGEVSLVGICSQFSYSDPNSGYQLLLRDEEDIFSGSSIHVVSKITPTNISTSAFTLNWETDVAGTTELFYGFTPELEIGHKSAAGMGTVHQISITGAYPSDLFYVQVFSVSGPDTAYGPVKPFITESISTGDITIYFTNTVDPSVSSGTDAVYLNRSADDTLIQYINRAKYTIDVAIYNFAIENISNIAFALNSAYSRGVVVRVVTDGSTGNSGIPELVAGIGKIARPAGDGIMHNKFMVIDGHSNDPDDPIVWTGSCNWTASNINTDANNLLFIQDMSLAKVYTLEFNEMFGSASAIPDPTQAKFGITKTDNTPHDLKIGGIPVEVYFSPSDGVNSVILSEINQADDDLMANTMLITRTDLADAIQEKANIGIDARVIVNNESGCSATVVETLSAAIGAKFKEYGEAGLLHNKYLITDPQNSSSNPTVLTGSHNWSSSADQINDENTLVIHDAGVANQFYQEFSERYLHGIPINEQNILNLGPDQEVCAGLTVTLDAGPFTTYVWSTGDLSKTIEVDSTGVGYGTKKIWCRVTDQYGLQSDTVFITFKNCSFLDDLVGQISGITLYPNPSSGKFSLKCYSQGTKSGILEIRMPDGRLLEQVSVKLVSGVNVLPIERGTLQDGIYILRIRTGNESHTTKLIIRSL